QALFRLKLLVLSFVHRNTLYETVLHFRFEAALSIAVVHLIQVDAIYRD
ncbi:hypothetical protein HDG32_007033, partial [Paraburkholderia sp. CI2]|nr:hypothetical protein [Paraburkholderia sp. CI2]